ncbi:tetratricopeptide repeat protein [Thalassobellus suaedae]|uniref:Tetratricopeptide repeat protein n=1 Tax=Thalassobellus suaedae TaxID=3074124 RepID=A0ABY9XQW7_9FLAO|nr:tetratricopeptide repeat protein [Flavobacteriaceae bacterium HL-DH14]
MLFKTEAQTSVLNVADSLYANGNYSKAIDRYKTYNNQQEVYGKIAKSYIAIGNYDEALKNYELSIEANPEDVLLKFEYARLLSKTKKHETAVKVFNDLVYIDDKNPNYHYELGLVLEKLKDSTAINRFRSAYELDQTHQKAIYRIAKYFLKHRKYDLVNEYVDKGLETYENNIELINLKAQNYYNKQDYDNAIIWFKKLIALDESLGFIYEKLSLSYIKLYDYEKAIEYGELALKFNPLDATSIYVIGTYYERINDFETAEKYISKAIFLLDKPLDTEYAKLATVLNQLKRPKEAITTLKKAIRENPTNQMTHFHLALTLENYYADYDAKIKVYEDLNKKFPDSKMKEFANHRIAELKKEKFLKVNKEEDEK